MSEYRTTHAWKNPENRGWTYEPTRDVECPHCAHEIACHEGYLSVCPACGMPNGWEPPELAPGQEVGLS